MASLKNVHIYPYHSENKIIIRVLTLGETIDFDEAKELADRIYAFLDEAKYLKDGEKVLEQKPSSPAHDPVLLFAQRVKAVTELFQCEYEQAVSIVEAAYISVDVAKGE